MNDEKRFLNLNTSLFSLLALSGCFYWLRWKTELKIHHLLTKQLTFWKNNFHITHIMTMKACCKQKVTRVNICTVPLIYSNKCFI